MVLPSFFKVLVNDFKSTLRIPLQFAKKFGDILPSDALIETGSAESWSVKIERVDDYYCFTHGWPEFVKDHQLERFDFLVFWLVLAGKSIFRVAIYGASGCEKVLKMGTTSYVPSNSKPEISELPLKGSCMRHCHTTPLSNIQGAKRKRGRQKKVNTVKNENPSDDAPISADSMEGMNPRFDRTLKAYHRYRMAVPKEFARKAGILSKRSVALKNLKGQSWCVELKLRKNNALLEMVEGWTEFWQENNLAGGTNCTFEFIPGFDCIQVWSFKRGQCHQPTLI